MQIKQILNKAPIVHAAAIELFVMKQVNRTKFKLLRYKTVHVCVFYT